MTKEVQYIDPFGIRRIAGEEPEWLKQLDYPVYYSQGKAVRYDGYGNKVFLYNLADGTELLGNGLNNAHPDISRPKANALTRKQEKLVEELYHEDNINSIEISNHPKIWVHAYVIRLHLRGLDRDEL